MKGEIRAVEMQLLMPAVVIGISWNHQECMCVCCVGVSDQTSPSCSALTQPCWMFHGVSMVAGEATLLLSCGNVLFPSSWLCWISPGHTFPAGMQGGGV